jgi:endonuclease/exonuclease/phosphatase family metal-dependent hydrolase
MKSFTPLFDLFKGYSIILLQECFDETFESLPSIFPDYFIFRGTLRSINALNSGLVILSKFPILKGEFIEYRHSNPFTLDTFSEKGFVSVLVDINGKKMRVINTHLQSCDFERYDVQALLQLDELFDYMETIYDPYYIIGGDFNIDIFDLKEKYVKYRGVPSLHYPEDPTIYINFTTSHSRCTRKLGYDGLILDYFIASKNIKMKKPITLTSYVYSDHNPVETHIEIL